MIKAINFDLDGILLDSEEKYIAVELDVLSKYGLPLTFDIITEYLGLRMDEYLPALSKRFNIKFDQEKAEQEILIRNNELYDKGIPLVAHVPEILSQLSKTYKLAMGTSREKFLAQKIMTKNHIMKYFDNAVYKEDVKNGKPNPEVFLKASELINVSPNQCIVIEDAESGIKAAKAAGMKVIARKAKHNEKRDFSNADFVITDLREILNIVKDS